MLSALHLPFCQVRLSLKTLTDAAGAGGARHVCRTMRVSAVSASPTSPRRPLLTTT